MQTTSVNGSAKFTDTMWIPIVKLTGQKPWVSSAVFLLLLVGGFVFFDPTNILLQGGKLTIMQKTPSTPISIEIPLNCTAFTNTRTCPKNYPTASTNDPGSPPPPTCPEYFRWIHEDLRPWAHTGITRDMVERARATFRLIVVDGRVYMEKLGKVFQTRDVYTVWGVVQLLRRYPGKLPDLELMFDCNDRPMIRSSDYSGPDNMEDPPVLFSYCGDDHTLNVVFPDWSFWGWPELNVKPWAKLLEELKEGNRRSKWIERQAFAYWKGNPRVGVGRRDLMTCNVSDQHDWGARLYVQNWTKEVEEGFQQSNLASQCIHRYKIYIEGQGWSVSEKYILACDSLALLVKPQYYDFFTRGLMPLQHYWPIRDNDKCRSIRHAVDWGNDHIQEAQEIGRRASKFIQEELDIDFVYDYMFHMLNQYSKLLQFKPVISPGAVEMCSEAMACSRGGVQRQFMEDTLVKTPANRNPCILLPPYDPPSLHALLLEKQTKLFEVECLENQTRHD